MDTSVLNVPASIEASSKSPGLYFDRQFTKSGIHPFDSIQWVTKDAVIRGSGGKEKFRQDNVEVPAWWGDNTVGIVAEKYFRVVNGVKEQSAKQMFSRVANWITEKGTEQGLFSTQQSAKNFNAELLYLLVKGMYAFNSPVWFNVGTTGDKPPQCSACFIQEVQDTMESIMTLARNEVMLFKGGSGTGSNLSSLRSSWEPLSRGGYASGPVSFMRGFDAFAGVTKSGGTTRRAAKMNILNIDHPDILEQQNGLPGFITCKADAEKQAMALVDSGKYSVEFNVAGNAYDRTGFQNANHSVRVTDNFMECVEQDQTWSTKFKNGDTHRNYPAKKLFGEVCQAAWVCGDPGIQFDSETNKWHTVPNSGRINASNPCSEYLFLDDTACNLGSLNLLKFVTADGFNVEAFKQAVDVVITAKEILVEASSYPTTAIRDNSHKYRTLGLGFTNLGALLTYWGLPYDSDEGRSVAGAISALMGGEAYLQSARMAQVKGPFGAFERNRGPMLDVINNHGKAAEKLAMKSADDPKTDALEDIYTAGTIAWLNAYELGKLYGFRNAQTTVIAPTGTISFLMDADTTGIEPMLGVVTFKKAVGEGYLKIPNNVIGPSLVRLGYSIEAVTTILNHISSHGTIHDAPIFKKEHGPIFAQSLGDFSIRPEAHVDMMAAVQPFISGGISKTVNMPNTSTPEDIGEIYMRAWKKGLKCIAIYRDGCKGSQPISTKTDEKKAAPLLWGSKKKLPAHRPGSTHKFRVGDVKGYLIMGNYPDGTLGEVFIELSKEGSFVGGMVNALAQTFSIALRHGTPIKAIIDQYKGMRFEPAGFTQNPDIPIALSIPDYIARWLEIQYVKTKEEPTSVVVKAQPEESKVIEVVDISGTPCSSCGGPTKRTGSCYTCTSCGETTGCG